MHDVNGLPKSSKNDWPNAPDVTGLTNINNVGNPFKKCATSSPGNEVSYKLDQLLESLQTQNCQIAELRNEVLDLKKNRLDDSTTKVEIISNKIEFRLSKMIEEYLIRNEREHNKKLEAFLAGRYEELLL